MVVFTLSVFPDFLCHLFLRMHGHNWFAIGKTYTTKEVVVLIFEKNLIAVSTFVQIVSIFDEKLNFHFVNSAGEIVFIEFGIL